MSAYYRTYYSSSFDESESSVIFVLVTDGEKTEVSFPEGPQESFIRGMQQALGARIDFINSVDKVTDSKTTAVEILDAITYNMMVYYYKEESGPEEFPSFEAAWESAKQDLVDDYTSTDFEPKLYPLIYEKDKGAITAAAGECPPATQDIALNLKNRKNAIDTAMYGPLNPAEPNEEYWQKMAGEWGVDTETAKKQRCGNCAVFVVTTDMRNCIAQGIEQGGSSQSDAWDAIGTAELGYCEAFDFKCAASRTCRAWVTGGPLDDNKAKE